MYRYCIEIIQRQSRLVFVLLLTSASLGLILLLFVSGDRGASQIVSNRQLALVEAIELTRQAAYLEDRQVFAQIENIEVAQLGFESSGILTEWLVDDGQHVRSGQLLAKLDNKRLKAEKDQLHASIVRKEADAELARLTANRTSALAEKKLISTQQLDEARLAFSAAQAAVAEIRAHAARLDVEQEKLALHAPFDGMIQKRFVSQGDVISAGQAIYRLQKTDQLRARVALSSADSQLLTVGKTVSLFKNGVSVDASIEAIIENKAVGTRTQDVLMVLPKNLPKLIPGDSLIYPFSREVALAGSWVPRSALSAAPRGMWQLMTLIPAPEGFVVQPLHVLVEYFDAEKAFVSGPFASDTLIAISGLHKIQANQLVAIQRIQQRTNTAKQADIYE